MPLFFSKSYRNKEVAKGDAVKTVSHLKSLVKNQKTFENFIYEEFSDINARQKTRMEQDEYKWEKATENENLNRYCNILPFDKNRVKLGSDNGRDYINASFILVPSLEQSYIATQGPLRHTIIDFWCMIAEQKTSVIVCLTPEIEKGIEKCARYWPEGNNEWKLVKDEMKVILKNDKKEELNSQADCIVRKIGFEIYNRNELIYQSKVVQLQFMGWSDHGVPKNPGRLLDLIRLTRTFYKDKKPAIVHCSAGCGRTGTFCVIDSAERMIKQKIGPIDPVLYLTEEFRKQRTTMVQTASQFQFCYLALLQFLEPKVLS